MKRLFFVLFLTLVAIYAKGQESIQLSDLVGNWKLTKVEELRLQGEVEFDKKVYNNSSYSGEIPFEGFECDIDGKLSYSGKILDGFKNGGNIQLNENSKEVFFHGKQIGLPFIFSWQNKPIEFSIECVLESNQQSTEKKVVRYYYEKFNE